MSGTETTERRKVKPPVHVPLAKPKLDELIARIDNLIEEHSNDRSN